jgi:hypothetical protein
VVEVETTDDLVASVIESRLRAFSAPAGVPNVRVRITVGGVAPIGLDRLPWSQGRPIYESDAGQVRFVEDQDLLLFDSNDVRAWARLGAGEVTMYAPNAGAGSAWLLSHPFLTIPLMELLKRRSVYSVHAGAVADNDRGMLLAGPSGAGKTTLTLALARLGLGFLGDDLAFLTWTANAELRLLPFPDEVDLLRDAVDHFPELRAALDAPRLPGWPKHALRIEDVVDVRLASVCTPVAVVLLGQRASTTGPVLEPTSAEAALLELVPNVLLTEPISSQANLDALGDLTRACPCYILHPGTNLSVTAAAVASLLT